MFPKFPMSGE
jgi:hypothetical protein